MNTQEMKSRIIKIFPPLRSLKDWYAVRSADACLISFPKCGRTWLRLMMGYSLVRQFGLENISLDKAMEFKYLAAQHPDIPKIIVTHDDEPFWKTPDELVTSKAKYKNSKVIFLARDPRDVVVSSYFEKKKRGFIYSAEQRQKAFNGMESYGGELSDYISESIGSFDTIIKFYNIWAKNRHNVEDFLLVRYEDIHANPQKELQRTLEFLGIVGVSQEILDEAVELAAFDKLHQMEKSGTFDSYRLKTLDKKDKESYKTRKGKVGGYVEYLTQPEIEYLTDRMKENLSEIYGY
jgi:hypothetical protein